MKDGQGSESMDNTMVAYLRLDNRLYSGLLSMLRPLIGNVVTRQVVKAFDAARRLAGVMRDHPDQQVLFEATDPPVSRKNRSRSQSRPRVPPQSWAEAEPRPSMRE